MSTPSLFYSLGREERASCRVLDYDTALGEEVVFYDFNAPTSVPAEVRRRPSRPNARSRVPCPLA